MLDNYLLQVLLFLYITEREVWYYFGRPGPWLIAVVVEKGSVR